MVRQIHATDRIMPRINPARQTHQSCQDLVQEYWQMLDAIPNLTQQARQTDERNQAGKAGYTRLDSLTAIGYTALRAIQGMPELAQQALVTGNPYAHDLADACAHAMAIVRMIIDFIRIQLHPA